MRRMLVIMCFLAGCASGGEDIGMSSAAHSEEPPPPPPQMESCWITGGGQIDPPGEVGGAFGGNAKPNRAGVVSGHWNHVTLEGDHFGGRPDFIECYVGPGDEPDPPDAIPNNADFGGSGTWNGEPGYTFEVHFEDHGEPNGDGDIYEITVFDSTGMIVYQAGGEVLRGNLQIHPPNPGHP